MSLSRQKSLHDGIITIFLHTGPGYRGVNGPADNPPALILPKLSCPARVIRGVAILVIASDGKECGDPVFASAIALRRGLVFTGCRAIPTSLGWRDSGRYR